MQNKTFSTMSHKLEEFLYWHNIVADSVSKDPDGMTIWTYEVTPELDRVVQEFRTLVAQRSTKGRI